MSNDETQSSNESGLSYSGSGRGAEAGGRNRADFDASLWAHLPRMLTYIIMYLD